MEEITYKYYLPPEKDQVKLGNYWWVVRLRPMGGSGKYEYMVNKDYSYKQVSEDFARMKTLTLAANAQMVLRRAHRKDVEPMLIPVPSILPRFGHRLSSMQHQPPNQSPAVHGGNKRASKRPAMPQPDQEGGQEA